MLWNIFILNNILNEDVLLATTTSITMLSLVSRSFTAHVTRWNSIRCFSDVSSRFEAAQVKLNTLTEDPGNAAKLKIYGLFKQVSSKGMYFQPLFTI